MKIYLASSWRNQYQPAVLAALRAAGHDVYDFRNPAPGDTGFSWRQIRPDLHENLNAQVMRETLAHPVAGHGFGLDFDAMKRGEVCVLLLPCGRSAHLEAGWMAGAGRRVVVLAPQIDEPELMYKCFDVGGATPIFATVGEVIDWLAEQSPSFAANPASRATVGPVTVCGMASDRDCQQAAEHIAATFCADVGLDWTMANQYLAGHGYEVASVAGGPALVPRVIQYGHIVVEVRRV